MPMAALAVMAVAAVLASRYAPWSGGVHLTTVPCLWRC